MVRVGRAVERSSRCRLPCRRTQSTWRKRTTCDGEDIDGLNGKTGEQRMGSQRKLQMRECRYHRLQRRAAGVYWILGCGGLFVVVASRAVLLGRLVMRVVCAKGFTDAVVDRE